MTAINAGGMMADTTSQVAALPEMRRAQRAIVVIDVVESVRLMQRHETETVDRWRRFVNEVRTQVLPATSGRLVKSLGDGLLLEFEHVCHAAAAAFEIQKRVAPYNRGCDQDAVIQLRTGGHLAHVIIDEFDVFGAGVNLAARLSGLAAPGEIVVSEAFRDWLTPGLDADVEDLGERYAKHLEQPIRAYKLHPVGVEPPGDASAQRDIPGRAELVPTIAILPFSTLGADSTQELLGELLADDLTAELARSPAWYVVSRLSACAFAGRALDLAHVGRQLGARYLVSGSVVISAASARVIVEVADVLNRRAVWGERLRCVMTDLVSGDSELLRRLVSEIGAAVIGCELELARGMPLSALHGRSVLLHGIACMHRMSRHENERAREALDHVLLRHPRHPITHAWSAKWYLIQLAQAWSSDASNDAARWRDAVRAALDLDSGNALALALLGHWAGFVGRNLDEAETRLGEALQSDPNEALAWLFLSAVHSHRGQGPAAMHAISRANRLSPLDPMRYFFDAFASMAARADHQFDLAFEYGCRSVRSNSQHLPSWVSLAISAVHAGRHIDAREAGARILAMRPDASVQRFVANHPAGDRPHVHEDACALEVAGIPR